MEPPAAVAEFRDGKVVAWAATQNPQAVQEAVAAALGIEKEDVTCHVTLLGGGFGRKSKPDYVVEAALLSKKVGKPVKVVWSREDDLQFDYFHAVAAVSHKAVVDGRGRPTAFISGRDALPDLGLVPGLGQDDQAGVRVHVDEARADDPPRGVERAVGLDPVEGAPEEAQPVALDPDRSVVARVARAIDDEAARDQDVEHAGPSGRQSITGSRRTAAARAATAGSSTGAGATPTRAGPPDRARR